jgi:hypothetical protein
VCEYEVERSRDPKAELSGPHMTPFSFPPGQVGLGLKLFLCKKEAHQEKSPLFSFFPSNGVVRRKYRGSGVRGKVCVMVGGEEQGEEVSSSPSPAYLLCRW